jgi:hypothetical protein
MKPEPLLNIFPGSWINANFDIWIGAGEDNHSWRLLLDARKAVDAATGVDEQQRALALEEIMIAEGSDWNWWYGPEHHSDHREEFDQIYRGHLANVYRALGLSAPAELSRPILRGEVRETHTPPTGPIRPVVDGVVRPDSEWHGAGVYNVDGRAGAMDRNMDGNMNGKRALLKEVLYGSDGTSIYIRVDFMEDGTQLEGLEIQVHPESGSTQLAVIRISGGRATLVSGHAELSSAAYRDVLELAVRVTDDVPGIRLSFWQDGLPVRSVPQEGSFRAG